MSPSYVSFETLSISCTNGSLSVRIQWVRTISQQVASVFYYFWSFFNVLVLFRPHHDQLTGVKRKLVLTSSVSCCLDAAYRLSLQAARKPYYMLPKIYRFPMNSVLFISVVLQFYLIVRHLVRSPRKKVASLICKMVIPFCFSFLIADFLYPAYNKRDKDGKLLIAIFAPLTGVAVKVISRIGVQRLWNIMQPSGILVCLISAIVFWFGGYFSSFTS